MNLLPTDFCALFLPPEAEDPASKSLSTYSANISSLSSFPSLVVMLFVIGVMTVPSSGVSGASWLPSSSPEFSVSGAVISDKSSCWDGLSASASLSASGWIVPSFSPAYSAASDSSDVSGS